MSVGTDDVVFDIEVSNDDIHYSVLKTVTIAATTNGVVSYTAIPNGYKKIRIKGTDVPLNSSLTCKLV